MKKIFLMAAVAAVTLTSCSKSETIEQPDARAMRFSNTVVSKATALNTGEFTIYGYKNTTLKFTEVYDLVGDHYKGSSSGLPATWTQMYYYDGINPYSFVGYAKTDATTTAPATAFVPNPSEATATEGTKLAFVAGNNNQIDLVTMAVGPIAPAVQTTSQVVTFQHALTRVRFTAYTTEVDALNPIVITNITLNVPQSQGEVTWANMGAGTMTATGGSAVTIIPTGFQTSLSDDATTPATIADDVYYIVPQALSATALSVSYTVNGEAAAPKVFDLSGITPMASGKSYNFNIRIDPLKITFNAELEAWNTDTAVPLP